MTEVWKPIESLNNLYEVSNLGNIRSLERTIINRKNNGRKPSIYKQKAKTIRVHNNGNGYLYFTVSIDSIRYNTYVHRAVASAFCEKDSGKNEVNHIDGNKTNNNSDNLEWVTKAENLHHAIRTGLKSNKNCKTAIKVLDKETNEIFDTIRCAANHFGIKYGLLKDALNRRRGANHRNPIYQRLVRLD